MNPFPGSLLGSATLAFALLTTAVATAEPKPGSWRGQSVTEFTEKENDAFGWQIVNDGVMGGLSEGKLAFTGDGTMRFTGTLSLENNGGFSTVRSGSVDLDLHNDLGLLLRVKGDGRTYEARLESDARFRDWPVSFAGEFKTTKGKWREVKIPFSAFKGGFRGRDLPDKELDPSRIQRIGILLADKKPGPFELEIEWIRTYGKGQGNYSGRSSGSSAETVKAAPEGPRNLIDTAVADGRFTTLKAALDAAGLTPFFQWDDPLTVFAPTDEAFAKLPEETLARLLEPENKEQLVAVLSRHVSAGDTSLASALGAGEVEPVRGAPLAISFSEGRVRVDDAVLIDADIECTDGTIHVIDTVLLPADLDSLAAAR